MKKYGTTGEVLIIAGKYPEGVSVEEEIGFKGEMKEFSSFKKEAKTPYKTLVFQMPLDDMKTFGELSDILGKIGYSPQKIHTIVTMEDILTRYKNECSEIYLDTGEEIFSLNNFLKHTDRYSKYMDGEVFIFSYKFKGKEIPIMLLVKESGQVTKDCKEIISELDSVNL